MSLGQVERKLGRLMIHRCLTFTSVQGMTGTHKGVMPNRPTEPAPARYVGSTDPQGVPAT